MGLELRTRPLEPIQDQTSASPNGGLNYLKRGQLRFRKPVAVNARVKKRVREAISRANARQQIQLDEPDRIRIRLARNGRVRLTGLPVPEALQPESLIVEDGPVVRALPRRRQVQAPQLKQVSQPRMSLESRPKIGAVATLWRLFVWIGAGRFFILGNFWDRLRGRDTEQRRAVRLREAFERVGGTFVKIGQQMASRLDLIPLSYCDELTSMLDRFPPFASEDAIALIESSTGRSLESMFSAFDPEPIGSASIACVYQAVLRESGERVAVKVRRPGIRKLFETDFKVLDILSELAERLTLIRPGVSQAIRDEFRNSLTSELDFRREARVQEVFGRQARQDKIRFFSAPGLVPELSNGDVIVQEFVSGMWLYEVLAGVEQNDPVAKARMAELNIDVRLLARRLLFMSNWGIFRSVAFHADPHPANIVVRANSELVFIDFGATGYFNSPRRLLYARMQDSYNQNNVWEMAKMSMAISEPLPAVDVNEVTRDLEKNFYDMVLAMKSKYSPWYERTTANSWISGLQIISKHNVGVPQDLLMFVRSSLLYDTLAARLHPRINFLKEVNRYFDWSKRQSRKRGRKAMRRWRQDGLLKNIDFEQVERLGQTFNGLVFRLQRLFSAPYDFAMLPFVIEKWVYVSMSVLRLFLKASLLTVGGLALGWGLHQAADASTSLVTLASWLVRQPGYLLLLAGLLLIHIRQVLYRLGDKIPES
jgi:ubiquinone biosynthesis protein